MLTHPDLEITASQLALPYQVTSIRTQVLVLLQTFPDPLQWPDSVNYPY
jgi:hypothetical protein